MKKEAAAPWSCIHCRRYLKVNGKHACELTRNGRRSYRLLPKLLTWPENFNCFWPIKHTTNGWDKTREVEHGIAS